MAYEVKEAGYRIYDAKTREEAENSFVEWKASVPQEMKGAFGDFERAWNNWQTEILNYFDHRVTNAYTESLNNLIRSTNRIGRGYSFEALRAKVLLAEGPEKIKRVRPRFKNCRATTLKSRFMKCVYQVSQKTSERRYQHFQKFLASLKPHQINHELRIPKSTELPSLRSYTTLAPVLSIAQ